MKMLGKAALFAGTMLLISMLSLQSANAARAGGGLSRSSIGGDSSLGIGFSVVTAGQNDLNSAIDAAHYSAGADTKNLGSAYEFYANWIYRFASSPYAFVLRPSYFTQSSTGSGTGGSFDYKLNGFTVFPIVRMYPLENSFIHFYMQAGVGYGTLNGEITAASDSLKFKGSAFGAMGGIGVDFCFTDAHCLTIEGNVRYLPIERNISDGGNCTNGSIPGVSQCGGNSEVELSGTDLRTTMSGVQGLIGYTMNF
ncbi:hypothetical protein [Bdellovibrio svalbardensis]|uniref:Outer membrane protein beta-barrel domain-containing protein n=1 Tax=Bdellovibrio svalbardensis TaxID=2972972 RepID=A0ABT6DI83_9BACT|nr:hypothetical protein [Bdellovibrio svalbardensis]MDG0815566.1 hypothetical protein [Bdellovibrio svalbardensis]